MTKLSATTALAMILSAMSAGASTAADRTITATPNADGSFTLRDSRRLADWGWAGTLPDGRAYKVLGEPSAGSPWAYVEVEGDPPSYEWVPAGAVCNDADLLMRMSRACP